MFNRESSGEEKDVHAGLRSVRALRRGLMVLAVALCLHAAPAWSAAKYDPAEAGQPVRVVAYVVHPVGVVLDYLILRPAYWIGSYEPFRTLFGRTD